MASAPVRRHVGARRCVASAVTTPLVRCTALFHTYHQLILHITGYNFNVVTCESCKAFFRRNALRPKVTSKVYHSMWTELSNFLRSSSALIPTTARLTRLVAASVRSAV